MFSVPVVLEARSPGTPNGVARGVGHRKTLAVGVADSLEFMGFGTNQ